MPVRPIARLALGAAVLSSAVVSVDAAPLYTIYKIDPVQPTDTSGTGNGVSPNGAYVTGFSSASGVNRLLLWTQGGGTQALPPVVTSSPTRPFNIPNAVNNNGVVAGTAASTFFGSSPLPILWKNNTAIPLPLPGGQTLGRANSLNDAETAVGSVNGGSLEQAAVFTESGSNVMTQTMPNGGVLNTAFGINNAGRIVGQALDPNNAAVTSGFFIDPGDPTATDIGALTGLGHNSAIAFGVSSNGKITGSSSLNSGSGAMPFLFVEGDGMTQVPLPAGTTTGQGRGVNADGWVVGNSSAATSIPFLYDGTQSYRLHDLIVNLGSWDLVSGTSNAAFSISDNGVITGRGLLNGAVTGYVMVPVPEPTLFGGSMVMLPVLLRRRRL
jgi:uncharacterized membrane protein